jgi:hypothetical protein
MDEPEPIEYTERRGEAILTALGNGNSRQAAAAAGDITYSTLREWLRTNEDFRKEVFKAESKAERAHVSVINRAAAKGSWQASVWWLERMRPDQFGKVDRVEILIRQQQAQAIAAQLAQEGIDVSDMEILREAENIRKMATRKAEGRLPPGLPRATQRLEFEGSSDVFDPDADE